MVLLVFQTNLLLNKWMRQFCSVHRHAIEERQKKIFILTGKSYYKTLSPQKIGTGQKFVANIKPRGFISKMFSHSFTAADTINRFYYTHVK